MNTALPRTVSLESAALLTQKMRCAVLKVAEKSQTPPIEVHFLKFPANRCHGPTKGFRHC